MLEQALHQWANAHQHGTVDPGWRYSRPSIHFRIKERRVTLTHSPGRSLHQVGLEEIYDLLKLASVQGWTINLPQAELREELREIDITRSHQDAEEETGFLLSHDQGRRYGRDFAALIDRWVWVKAANAAWDWDLAASRGEATPRACGFMIMSDHERAELARPAAEYVEAVKRHLVFH